MLTIIEVSFPRYSLVFAMTCTSHADVAQDTFGWLHDEVTGAQLEVRRYTLTSSGGAMAQVIDYGATLTTLLVPDRYGQVTDINMGFDDLDGKMTFINYQ
jgi:aldose 1-epimerase